MILTAPFAKAHTASVEMMATTTRMFLCQFTNYCILIFMIKSSILFFNDIPGDHYDNINA